MHPQGYATEAIPLQGLNYGGLPGQPGVVQHTAVNITRGQRVITESPKDHIIWSLCCFVYSNPFCLGLAALIYAIKLLPVPMACIASSLLLASMDTDAYMV
ncbi:unnamed protein product [Oreochromis niloticus]|nr:unnamed protein product [Mustela putorius furo]